MVAYNKVEPSFKSFSNFFRMLVPRLCTILLTAVFVLMHKTLLTIMLNSWYIWNCFLRLRNFWAFLKRSHRRPTIPVVIFAARPFSTNNSEWTVFAINGGPVVIYTVFIAFANFYYRRPIVPIMVLARWSILANDFFVMTVLS